MTSARIHLPSLGLAHPPELDRTVIGSRDNERKGGMESGKVDATIVAFEDILDSGEIVKSFE